MMELVHLAPDDLTTSPDLARTGPSRMFTERIRASIEEMGLAEPLKVVRTPSGKYLVIDGTIRLAAIRAIRSKDKAAFATIPTYLFDYTRRYELRYQSDIYQDLLPSQLATLVEHLHQTESVRKTDIARYIGVSPATLRNYTGLWRLIQRGGIFARIVDLMDVGVLPASNPYAWLRLTDEGLRVALERGFSGSSDIELWMELRIANARRGHLAPYSLKAVERATGSLPATCYRKGEEERNKKRSLGLRRSRTSTTASSRRHGSVEALEHLQTVIEGSPDPVLRAAAQSLAGYLS